MPNWHHKLARKIIEPSPVLMVIGVLILVTAVGIAGYAYHQQQLAIAALHAMTAKGIDAHYPEGAQTVIYIFKHGNVTDRDLLDFIPAFNGYAPNGFGTITEMRLKYSMISPEVLEIFRTEVPDCKLSFENE